MKTECEIRKRLSEITQVKENASAKMSLALKEGSSLYPSACQEHVQWMCMEAILLWVLNDR